MASHLPFQSSRSCYVRYEEYKKCLKAGKPWKEDRPPSPKGNSLADLLADDSDEGEQVCLVVPISVLAAIQALKQVRYAFVCAFVLNATTEEGRYVGQCCGRGFARTGLCAVLEAIRVPRTHRCRCSRARVAVSQPHVSQHQCMLSCPRVCLFSRVSHQPAVVLSQGMNHLTNEGLFSIGKYCTRLTVLSVAGKLNFNAANISHVTKRKMKSATKKQNKDKKKCVRPAWLCVSVLPSSW